MRVVGAVCAVVATHIASELTSGKAALVSSSSFTWSYGRPHRVEVARIGLRVLVYHLATLCERDESTVGIPVLFVVSFSSFPPDKRRRRFWRW